MKLFILYVPCPGTSLLQPLLLVSVDSAFIGRALGGNFLHWSKDGRGTKRTTAQNEQSTGRYSQLTTLLQTAPSRPDSGDYVQDMSAEPFVIPSRGKPWQWCGEEGQLNDCL